MNENEMKLKFLKVDSIGNDAVVIKIVLGGRFFF